MEKSHRSGWAAGLGRARAKVVVALVSVVVIALLRNYQEIRAAIDLGLVPPVSVTRADYYRDGGTSALVLRDVLGRDYAICMNGRLSSPTAGRWYTGAYPTHAGARILPLNASDPRSARVLAQTWLRRSFSEEKRELMGRRYRFVPTTPDEEVARNLVWYFRMDDHPQPRVPN